ncbi:MAG: FMN-binding protein [Deltaproteobacteria bacterium]|nr:FMN-binding protein [Deltaproteobacteria bacterium]MBW2154333.1 FMN-binding protein [Deltaproteobacteria bacterium]
MSNNLRSILFAVVLCFVISLLLTAASTGLQSRQQRNVQIDKQKNILKSVGLTQEGKKYTAQHIEKLYRQNIQELWADPSGMIIRKPKGGEQVLPIYLYVKDKEIKAYIVPINSRGLWGRILGYLAIERDGSTISGFTVYKHSETPGLGGEIEKQWFQKNFVGKKIVNQDGEFVSISIAKGRVEDRLPKSRQVNYVDGISGATLTGKYLTAGMREILARYEPVSIRFRKHMLNQTER